MDIFVILVSIAVILASCELFVNAIEWLGHKLGLGEGAVGSILAAVGTAMPETMIPLVAIILVGGEAATEIGIGAILGAPFLLGTAAFAVTGTAIFIFSARGRRTTKMRVNERILGRDMSYFLVVYCVAIIAAFIPSRPIKALIAVVLLSLYGLYFYRTWREGREAETGEDLAPLHFYRWGEHPHLSLVVAQLVLALGGIIGGARIFVAGVEHLAVLMGVSPLVLSLIIAPLATELPEKFNSVIWVSRWKDTLAMGNITGAMVFQSCIPVAVGLLLTPWVLDTPALVSATIAILSTATVYGTMRWRGILSPHLLALGGIFYLGFIFYIVRLA